MGRSEVAHKLIMEISLLIMEKSWNKHGILIVNLCGNPVLWLADLSRRLVGELIVYTGIRRLNIFKRHLL